MYAKAIKNVKTIFKKDETIVVIVAFIITTARLIIIHRYVGWRFLWGGDQVPVLNPGQLLSDVFTLRLPWRNLGILYVPQLSTIIMNHAVMKLFSLLLGVNSLETNLPGWLANSFWFLVGIILLWYVASSLGYINRLHKVITFTLLSLLFAFNPWATVDTFKSYLGSTSLQAFMNFVLFAYYLRLMRAYATGEGPRGYENALAIAAAVMLYGSSPSGTIRGVAFLLTLEALFLAYILIEYMRHSKIENQKYVLILSIIPIAVIALLAATYLLSGYAAPLKERVAASWGGLTQPPEALLHPPYANAVNSFVGLTSWIAHSNYMPYHRLYEKGLIAAFMILWPLLGLGGLLAIIVSAPQSVDRPTRLQLLMLTLLASIFIAWGTALNPPLIGIKERIITALPYIVKVIPWGLSSFMLKTVYMLGTSYTIGYIFTIILEKIIYKKSTDFKSIMFVLAAVVAFTALAAILYTALPIFNGSVFGQYFNESIKGFNIPKSYIVLASLKTDFYEHILLMPSTQTYISTKWGFQGSVGWYHTLNTAMLVKNFAPYSQYTEWNKVYNELTRPCMRLKKPKSLVNHISIKKIKVINASLLDIHMINNNTMTISIYANRPVDKIDIILPLKNYLNISKYRLLEINISVESNTTRNIIVQPIVFISSPKTAGAHILPKGRTPLTVSKIYLVGKPDKPWPSSKYNPAKVNGFIVRLLLYGSAPKEVGGVELSVKLRLDVGSKASFCKSYIDLLKTLNIKYIVVDRSINTYNDFYKIVESILKNNYIVIYNDSILAIYMVTNEAKPVHLINGSVNMAFTNIKPYSVELRMSPVSAGNVTLTIPFLYSNELVRPITAAAKEVASVYHIRYIDYRGIMGINLFLDNKLELSILYSKEFITLYIINVTIELIPLILFAVATAIYVVSRGDEYNCCSREG